jgi:uridylate kinase
MGQARPRYRRVILKISGESFCAPGGLGLQQEALARIGGEIAEVAALPVQVAVVVGGGNFLRGATSGQALGIGRATADYMGMLATVLNGLALQDTLEALGQPARVQSALSIARACEAFDRRRCLEHLASGRVVILVAGTGNPHVTTDSCASIRGVELEADVLLKGTKVDGVYDSDPATNPDARRYERVSYAEVIEGRLGVMDIGAAEMCERYGLPVIVFNLMSPGHLRRVVMGEPLGTFMGAS